MAGYRTWLLKTIIKCSHKIRGKAQRVKINRDKQNQKAKLKLLAAVMIHGVMPDNCLRYSVASSNPMPLSPGSAMRLFILSNIL